MNENRSTKTYVNRSKSSHMWRFRQKTPDALEVEAAIQESGFGDCSTFFRDLVEKRKLLTDLLDTQAKQASAPVLALCASPLGLRAVNKALDEAGFIVVKKETWLKWTTKV